jgi:class 3 adenylate cyclase
VLLLDLVMPDVNGLEVLRRLKADDRLRHLPVVMISALDEVEGVGRCIELGAEDYLSKPFNPVLLRARINACLEKKRLRDREVVLRAQVECERRRADELLQVVLPAEVVRELKDCGAAPPRRHENVAVMFCDLVGFTRYCDGNRAEDVVGPLQQLVETWEAIAARHQVEKIKTIGDAFMAAAGLLQRPADHPVLHCVRCGLEMIAATRALPVGWDLRVGIHLGPVVAGVIGRRQFGFDLWGDTVNTAARVESHGVPGAVVLSRAAWEAVAGRCRGEPLPAVEAKGKGRMEMVRFDGPRDGLAPVRG